jgi:hypothetical protein
LTRGWRVGFVTASFQRLCKTSGKTRCERSSLSLDDRLCRGLLSLICLVGSSHHCLSIDSLDQLYDLHLSHLASPFCEGSSACLSFLEERNAVLALGMIPYRGFAHDSTERRSCGGCVRFLRIHLLRKCGALAPPLRQMITFSARARRGFASASCP